MLGNDAALTDELSQLEQQIGNNLRRFFRVGQALQSIVDKDLYKIVAGAKSLGEYCLERFGFDDKHAYRLIAASRVLTNLEQRLDGVELPINERQLRPLTALEAQEQAEAWQLAWRSTKGARPRGIDVERAVMAIRNHQNELQPQLPPQQEQTEALPEMDPYLYGFEEVSSSTDPESVAHGRDAWDTSIPLLTDPVVYPNIDAFLAPVEKPYEVVTQVPSSSAGTTSSDNESSAPGSGLPSLRSVPGRERKNAHYEIPIEHRHDKIGYWRNRALNAEQERERLSQENTYLRETNRELSLKLAMSSQLRSAAPSG